MLSNIHSLFLSTLVLLAGSFYDPFRVEDGFIAEHWDTIETIPPRDEWKNTNGKF